MDYIFLVSLPHLFTPIVMNGKDKCSYLKAIRREIAAANGIDLEIPECTFEGECSGTCPRCEGEVRQLERAISQRRKLSQKVAILGVAAGLSLAGMSPAVAQTETDPRCDSTWSATMGLTDAVIEVRHMPGFVSISYNKYIGFDAGPTSTVFDFAEKEPVRRIGNAEKPDLSKYDVKAPVFPGGEVEMKRFIRENFIAPEADYELVADGDIIVEFRVNTKGKVGGVKVKGKADPALKNAVKNVFRSMPLWTPATVNGEVVPGTVQVPITFLRKEE